MSKKTLWGPRHQPEGKPLPDRLLEIFREKGSITTLDMYKEFKEYKTNSLPVAIKTLRDRGHVIDSVPIGKTRLGHTITRYVFKK